MSTKSSSSLTGYHRLDVVTASYLLGNIGVFFALMALAANMSWAFDVLFVSFSVTWFILVLGIPVYPGLVSWTGQAIEVLGKWLQKLPKLWNIFYVLLGLILAAVLAVPVAVLGIALVVIALWRWTKFLFKAS